MSDILDRISPDEAHLPPSARTWARLVSPDDTGDADPTHLPQPRGALRLGGLKPPERTADNPA